MPETVNLDITTLEESVSVTTTDGGTVEVAVQAQRGETGATGATGAPGPNTVTSATTTDFTTGQVLYANGANVGSLSRSGIDTRTTFPNDDVTAATHLATRGALVRRNATNGRISVERLDITTDYDPIIAMGNDTDGRAELNLNTNALLFGSGCAITGGAGNFSFPSADSESSYILKCAPIVVNGFALSAVVGQDHIVIATATINDPTPSEGAWYRVIVRNGTATVAGTAYATSGTIIERSYHSGAWANRVYNETPVLGANVSTALAVNVGSAGAFVVNGGALGTPSSGTLTSCTGLPISTGVSGLGANVATFLATPSSANLAAAVTDETGTGSLVFATSPTIVTPTINQINTSGQTLITGTGTSGILQIRATANNGFSSGDFQDLNGVQRGGFGYGNPGAGAYPDQVYLYATSRRLCFGASVATHMCINTSSGVSIGTTTDAGASSLLVATAIAVGTAAANNRSVLDLQSTTKGFLPPRMTTAQRDAISSPPAGLMIYNTSTNKLNVYTTAWEQVTSA